MPLAKLRVKDSNFAPEEFQFISGTYFGHETTIRNCHRPYNLYLQPKGANNPIESAYTGRHYTLLNFGNIAFSSANSGGQFRLGYLFPLPDVPDNLSRVECIRLFLRRSPLESAGGIYLFPGC